MTSSERDLVGASIYFYRRSNTLLIPNEYKGTLCEALLMAEAFEANVIFPNKSQGDGGSLSSAASASSSSLQGCKVEFPFSDYHKYMLRFL